MNRQLFILAALVFFLMPWTVVRASTLGAPPNNLGLVGYWTMDGKDVNWSTGRITDKSGNSNPGLLSNMSTTTSSVVGKIGQALNFNGTSQGVIVANSSPLTIESGDASWSTWVYPLNAGDSVDYEQVILDKEQGGAGNGGIYMFLKSNHLCIYNGSASCGSITIKNGTWHHVMVVKSGTTALLYINGVAETPIAWTGGGQPQNLGIGVDSATAGRFFTGTIDDVRVYNRALSASEVARLYNAGSVKQSASLPTLLANGLVGYWTMDGKDTNWATGRMTDRSGNGNTGIVNGMSTTTSPVFGKMGQALAFNGTNQYVNAPLSLSAGSAYTVSFWRKNNNPQTNADPTMFSNQNAFSLIFGMEGTRLFYAGSNYFVGDYTTVNNSTAWQHLTYVLTGTTVTLYINGIFQETQNFSSPAVTQVDIGDILSNRGSFNYSGTMDDVRVYNRALSASEVKQLYTAGVGSKTGVTLPDHSQSGGLITYWSLNGKDMNWRTGQATDGSGSGNTGRLTSLSTTTSPAAGRIGQGLSFDGTTQYIVGTQTVNTARVTMSVWFKKSGNPASQAWIAGFQDGLNGPSWDKDLYLKTDGKITWYVYDGSSKNVDGSTVVTDGKWHHIVGTADGTNAILYVDGVQDGTFPVGPTYTGYTVPNIFVGGTNGSGVALSQTVDEFRVYNRALSLSEIKALYNQGR